MRRKNRRADSLGLDTIIGANTVFEGSISSERSVCIEGRVQGRIEAKGEVVVGCQGKVEADILADSVTVGGQIVGNVTARRRLEITATGRVCGDIEAGTITVAEGGMVDGFCKMVALEPAYPQLEERLSANEGERAGLQSPAEPVENVHQA